MLLPLFLLPFALTLVLSGLPVQAQSNRDSLLTVLKANPHDTTKVDIYLSLHQIFPAEDTAKAMAYLRKAISISEKIADKKRVYKSYLALCRYSRNKGQVLQAKRAISALDKQRSLFQDSAIEASFYMEHGFMNHVEGNYKSAVHSFLRALSIYEEAGNTEGTADCYNMIGSAYWELEELDNALTYFLKAVELFEGKSGNVNVGRFLGNIGLIYRAKNDFKKALEYYQRSLEINQQYDKKLDMAINLQNIGVLHQKMGDFHTALKYMKRSNALSRTINDQIGILYTNHGIAAMYGELGNYPRAIAGLEEALQLAKALKIKEEIKNLHESFSDTYEKMGQFKLAYQHRKEFEVWKDSIANENHLNQVKELEIKYETEKKDKQITLLAKEKELQAKEAERQATLNKASLSGLVLMSILAAMLVYIFRQRLRHQKLLAAKQQEVKEANFRQQMSELEVKALRAQINPHFLFNCMNSINRMILNSETESASRYLTKFSKLVRMILESTEASRVSLADELTMLETYIQLEVLRFKGRINYKIIVDEFIDQENTYLPSMVLQPFVENAIWHGLMHKEEAGMITIAIREKEDRLLCSIEDNGVGREKARVLQEKSIVKQKSMGVKLTEDRLRLLSKEHMEELIRITDLRDSLDQVLGTRVDIMVPIT